MIWLEAAQMQTNPCVIKKECRFTEFKQSIFYLLSFTKGQSNVFLDYKRGHGEIIFSPASATKVTEAKKWQSNW